MIHIVMVALSSISEGFSLYLSPSSNGLEDMETHSVLYMQ